MSDKALPVCEGPGRVCMVHSNTGKDHIPRRGTNYSTTEPLGNTDFKVLRQQRLF